MIKFQIEQNDMNPNDAVKSSFDSRQVHTIAHHYEINPLRAGDN